MVRLLIVEDELISQDMCNMLSNMGYHVIGDAMDYKEAIELLNKETPDLILLDVNLNGKKDGIDLAQEINNTYKAPFISPLLTLMPKHWKGKRYQSRKLPCEAI
jgi:two-component SAPR family response regulator